MESRFSTRSQPLGGDLSIGIVIVRPLVIGWSDPLKVVQIY